jgi:hypothetical protein
MLMDELLKLLEALGAKALVQALATNLNSCLIALALDAQPFLVQPVLSSQPLVYWG